MHQSELNRSVARACGESVATIKRLGFMLADPERESGYSEDEFAPKVIDWDELEQQRYRGLFTAESGVGSLSRCE